MGVRHPLSSQVRAGWRDESRKDEAMTAKRDLHPEQQQYLPFLPSSYPPAPVV
jgi:hypothetical protein